MALTQVNQNMIAGGPAFSAYQSTLQSLTGTASTKVQLQTEVFDTNNNFDNATNYRFTPTVAGYYMVVGQIYTGAANNYQAMIYKNGSSALLGGYTSQMASVSGLILMNGSTDYLELFAYASATANSTVGSQYTYFHGFLARPA